MVEVAMLQWPLPDAVAAESVVIYFARCHQGGKTKVVLDTWLEVAFRLCGWMGPV